MDSNDWNDRYATAEYVWKADPNVFLAAEAATLPVGRAVDLACGEGRNAVWLAEQGWDVTGVDFSDVGLDKGRRLAADRGVDVTWVCADATTWSPPDDGYDLVALCYLQLPTDQRRGAIGVAARALAPGGILLVVAHDAANLTDGTGGPPDRPCSTGPTTCSPTSRTPASTSASNGPRPSSGSSPAPSVPRSIASSASVGSPGTELEFAL